MFRLGAGTSRRTVRRRMVRTHQHQPCRLSGYPARLMRSGFAGPVVRTGLGRRQTRASSRSAFLGRSILVRHHRTVHRRTVRTPVGTVRRLVGTVRRAGSHPAVEVEIEVEVAVEVVRPVRRLGPLGPLVSLIAPLPATQVCSLLASC